MQRAAAEREGVVDPVRQRERRYVSGRPNDEETTSEMGFHAFSQVHRRHGRGDAYADAVQRPPYDELWQAICGGLQCGSDCVQDMGCYNGLLAAKLVTQDEGEYGADECSKLIKHRSSITVSKPAQQLILAKDMGGCWTHEETARHGAGYTAIIDRWEKC